jgi:hypothetical protein
MGKRDGVLIHEFTTRVMTEDGRVYRARAYARQRGHDWIGWLVFVSDDGNQITTDRETTQPDRRAVEYWASGLEPIYLDGALTRARELLPR